MTSFIVISTTESLNEIVDNIVKYCPQNPEVSKQTNIGTGKLVQKQDGLYYNYNYGKSCEPNNQSGSDLYALLSQQFAEFRSQSGLDEELPIFILENPIEEEDVERAKLVHESLRKSIGEKRTENNCNIVRVLFSYNVGNPTNIYDQVGKKKLSSIILPDLNETDDTTQEETEEAKQNDKSDEYHTPVRILYLDNQDRNGALIATTKEEHDLMVSRMLCDFMMLYSGDNSAYNVRNAADSSATQVFSLGYAECMYYYKDVERYFELVFQRDIRKKYLKCENDSDELDVDNFPLGLEKRKQKLSKRYENVPYDKNIGDYPDSVDKEIDDIVISIEKYIKDYRQIDKKCPKFVKRADIYETWLINKNNNKIKFYDIPECEKERKRYEKLIDYIQKDVEFKKYISENSKIDKNEPKNKGCNIFARIVNLFRNSNDATNEISDNNVSPLENINKIPDLLERKESYKILCGRIENVESDIKKYQKQIDDFELTKHSKTYSNLIDIDKLKDFSNGDNIKNKIDDIVGKWKQKEKATLDDLMKITEEICKKYLDDFKYIKYDYPFVFLKEIDLEILKTRLRKLSIPFIQTTTVSAFKENLTVECCYHDNGKVSNVDHSKHIESKYCMFQILQMDSEIIKGLSDLCEIYEEPQISEVSDICETDEVEENEIDENAREFNIESSVDEIQSSKQEILEERSENVSDSE